MTGDGAPGTGGGGSWHYGLIARWWAEFNRPEPSEVVYLREAIAAFGEPALDLGCGTGRLLVPLLADGVDVDGTDISADMVDLARHAIEAAGLDATRRLAVQAFHDLARPRRYGTVYSIGSFAIGGRREHDAEALRRMHDHLLPGGGVVLSYEVLLPDGLARLGDPARVYPAPWPATGERRRLADGGELELIGRTAAWDAGAWCLTLEMRARLWRGDVLVREEEGRLRNVYYPPDEVRAMLETAGFADVRVEGPYTGRPPDPSDDTVVVTARRVS